MYLKSPNYLNSHVIAYKNYIPDELEIDTIIDKEEMYNKSFHKKMSDMFELVGWEVENELTFEDILNME